MDDFLYSARHNVHFMLLYLFTMRDQSIIEIVKNRKQNAFYEQHFLEIINKYYEILFY